MFILRGAPSSKHLLRHTFSVRTIARLSTQPRIAVLTVMLGGQNTILRFKTPRNGGMMMGIVRRKASISLVAAAAIAVTLLCGCSQQSDQHRSAAAAPDLAAQLREMEERSYAAWTAGDADFWSSALSDSYVGWGASGRTDKDAAVELLSGSQCRITAFRLGEPQITQLTPDAALLVHRTEFTGVCNGTPLAPAYTTLTVFVREADQWKIAYRAQSAIIDPMQATIPADSDVWTSGATGADPATQALLAREVEVVNAWKDHDGARMGALFGPELQFVDIFGTHIGSRDEALEAWSGEGCNVQGFEFTGAQAQMFTPDFGVLTYRAAYDGACFGQDLWPILGTAFYVRRGEDWFWSSGINVLAGAPE